MQYQDRIYKNQEIKEPVILALINSPALQRLKGIDQAGYFEPQYPGTSHSRFEHSVGVYLLLRQYGAKLEEQIAGLIHDVSHSAFSHCIDYVLAEGSQTEHSHQDNVFEGYVKKSTIPSILKKYGYDSDYILNDDNFPLKETQLPDLCADRIDYSLRGMLIYQLIDQKTVEKLLKSLKTVDNQWIFQDFETAKTFAELFMRLNQEFYCGFSTARMFRTVGDYLKYSLNQGYISLADLYQDDRLVLNKIKKNWSQDQQLLKLFKRMNCEIQCENNPLDFEAQVLCKSRMIDPKFEHAGQIQPISAIDPDWGELVNIESQPKKYFLKFAD